MKKERVKGKGEGGKDQNSTSPKHSNSLRHSTSSSIPSPVFSFIPHPSSLIPKLRRALRGEVSARVVALEALRRSRVKLERRRERASLARLNEQPARLRAEFARMSGAELLKHFRKRATPQFFAGFNALSNIAIAEGQHKLFPEETARLIESALNGELRNASQARIIRL
jgi:hypothetical protein